MLCLARNPELADYLLSTGGRPPAAAPGVGGGRTCCVANAWQRRVGLAGHSILPMLGHFVRVAHAILSVSALGRHCYVVPDTSPRSNEMGRIPLELSRPIMSVWAKVASGHRAAAEEARPRVSSSANSRSPPIGSPDAIRVTSVRDVAQHPHQIRRGGFALGVGVGGDDDLGDVHAVDALADTVQQSRIRSCSGPMPDNGPAPRPTRGSGRGTRGCARRPGRPWAPRRRTPATRHGARSPQMRQRSASDTLPQTSQNVTPSRTRPSTAVSRSMSGGSTESR